MYMGMTAIYVCAFVCTMRGGGAWTMKGTERRKGAKEQKRNFFEKNPLFLGARQKDDHSANL